MLLDSANMTLEDDLPEVEIPLSRRLMGPYFDASAPDLVHLAEDDQVEHQRFADSLRRAGFNGFVSIEMRAGEVGTNAERVARALRLTGAIYRG